MTKRELGDFLQDILEAIAEIEDFISGLSFEGFAVNREEALPCLKSVIIEMIDTEEVD